MNSFALSIDRMREEAPAIFAPSPIAGVSARYRYFSTVEVIDLLKNEGWAPVRVEEHRVRLNDRRGFQAHVVRFAREQDLAGDFNVHQVRPEIVLKNSHDRSSAFHIDTGLFRKVCSNGLVVSDASFASIAIRHVDVVPDAFIHAARRVVSEIPGVLETVQRWQAVPLPDVQRLQLAASAIALRWPDKEDAPEGLTPRDLLAHRRYGDQANDLWTTFNVVQENLIRGTRYREGFRRRHTRSVGSPSVEIDLNKDLWRLAETFSRN